jgi:dipeptidyl aminopeptidase/acylaminoacyl peptidase
MKPIRGLFLLFLAGFVSAQEFKPAPEAIRKVLDVPPTPTAKMIPGGRAMLLAETAGNPPITDLARPYLRLAGLRIDPATDGPRLPPRYTRFRVLSLEGKPEYALSLPDVGKPGLPQFSADGARFTLAVTEEKAIALYVGTTADGKIRRVEGVRLNAVLGNPIHWLADGKQLVVTVTPSDRPTTPPAPVAAPAVQESNGKAAPVRTYQDLLTCKYDESLFEYHATARLALVDAETLTVTPFGPAALFASVAPAPDGKHLLVTTIQRPYSYSQPASAFPRRVQVWNLDGKALHTVTETPVADKVPIGGVPTRPRAIAWVPTQPATLCWAEALDGGDPSRKAGFRDSVRTQPAPFTDAPREVMKTKNRFQTLQWTEKGVALVTEYDRDKRRRQVFRVDPGPDAKPELVWNLAVQDRYNDPGTPLTRRLPSGHVALRQEGDSLLLLGQGAAKEGARPFLDRFDLPSKKTTRLFQSEANIYESPVAVLDEAGTRLVTRHESATAPPNYRLRTPEGMTELTTFKDSTPELRQITRQLVLYKREDDVLLSMTVYLPPGYKQGTRLPTLVWAYPREFTDAALAGQTVGVGNRFTTLGGASHLFFLLQGYAVIESSMPIVGSVQKANDTFVDQIVMNAKATVDKAVELGFTDRDRVAVGGHSYGAFMTANLLAHSDLFRAGLARSGAYNRTLTPFGFQNERRTLWQAPEVYLKMSPFMAAKKIKTPILLIHGADDNNSGTFPIQSERLFQAIKGNGGIARHVVLPHESHGYVARESIEHALAEMLEWCDKHVKNAKPRS